MLIAISYLLGVGFYAQPAAVGVRAAPAPPAVGPSRYVDDLTGNPTLDFTTLQSAGCNDVQHVTAGRYELTLDFKKQWYVNGVFAGTQDWSGTTRSVAEIENAAQGYAFGWTTCGAASSKTLTLGIGTNNETPFTNATAGTDWANLVLSTEITEPSTVSQAVQFVGASDIEPDFNSPANSLAWANAYNQAGTSRYIDYGSASGCPLSGAAVGSPGGCLNGWTQSDVHMVAWGILRAFSLPEIYNPTGANAQQWQQISQWAGLNQRPYGGISFDGVLTEQMACQQVDRCTPPYVQGYINNTTTAGWNQLNDQCANNGWCYVSYNLSDQRWDV